LHLPAQLRVLLFLSKALAEAVRLADKFKDVTHPCQ
jgi:hypothetical protein